MAIKIKSLIEELNETLKEISLLISQLSIEERTSNKPQELIELVGKKKKIELKLISISLKNPIPKTVLHLMHTTISSHLIKEGLQIEVEKVNYTFNDEQIQVIIEKFNDVFDTNLVIEEIIKSLKNNTIYQDILDLRGSYVMSIDDISDLSTVYKLIIKFKIRAKFIAITRELFPKLFDITKFDHFFEDHLHSNKSITEISKSIYEVVESRDRPRIKRMEKLKEEKRIKFFKDLFEGGWDQVFGKK